jgi:hypothetical protein
VIKGIGRPSNIQLETQKDPSAHRRVIKTLWNAVLLQTLCLFVSTNFSFLHLLAHTLSGDGGI